MQLSRRQRAPGATRKGFFAVGREIVRKETPLGLYKGLGAVVTGLVPKMAIRFSSFEFYKSLAAKNPETGRIAPTAVFLCIFPSCSSAPLHPPLFARPSSSAPPHPPLIIHPSSSSGWRRRR